MDEEILKDLINSPIKDIAKLNNLSHRPEQPITNEKLEYQLSKLRAYKCISVIYCVQCERFRFIRSHHCKELGECVSRMDHYCAFVDNCIGKKNHRYFLQYLVYTYLTIMWMCFDLLWYNKIVSEYNVARGRMLLLHCCVCISVFFAFYVFILWVGQVRRMFKNLTMIEESNGEVEVIFF